MNNPGIVTAELELRLVVPETKTVVPLMASFYYAAADPFAVKVAFHVGLDSPVEWTISRDLLSSGIEDTAGLGDVKLWPSTDPARGGKVLNMELSSPYGMARFEAPTREVSDFLRRTYKLVPVSREAEHLDIDAGLANIFRRTT